MICLGIETSCDDSSVALLEDGRLLNEQSSSQADMHALFGGVVPEMASREHARFIGPLCDRAFTESGLAPEDVDVVAAARGPGLLGSLLVGSAFAKAFALGTGARFIGVNHLHAHVFAAGLEQPVPLPALALLVSGGHTHLYCVDGPEQFEVLGRTLDDAAGEAFDKAGKMLGLPYPAGKHIDNLANEGDAQPRLFPRPYLDNDTLDFSFSGLKTAMYTHVSSGAVKWAEAGFDAQNGDLRLPGGQARRALADICASYRLAVVETLAAKTLLALRQNLKKNFKSLILAGGVAANSLLRKVMADLAASRSLRFICPSPGLCADNGAMIAYLGYLLSSQGFYHDLDMEAVARGRRMPEDMRSSLDMPFESV